MASQAQHVGGEEQIDVAGMCAELFGVLLFSAVAFMWFRSICASLRAESQAKRRRRNFIKALQEEHDEQLRAVMAEHEATKRELLRYVAELERTLANACPDSPLSTTSRARSAPTNPPGASTSASEQATTSRMPSSGSRVYRQPTARQVPARQETESAPMAAADSEPRARNTTTASYARVLANENRMAPPTPLPDPRWARQRHLPTTSPSDHRITRRPPSDHRAAE